MKLDYWWMDAGWYPSRPVGWPKTGTWEVDTRRFPKGLREVSDYIQPKGAQTIVWFEPERVRRDTWLAEQHPEWILGGANGGLLNLGNPEAWAWLVDHIDKLLVEQRIGLYRQEFNIDPLTKWRANDAPDRQGITEIKHVMGYLAYWDELRRRHPGILIDTCAQRWTAQRPGDPAAAPCRCCAATTCSPESVNNVIPTASLLGSPTSASPCKMSGITCT